MTERGPSEGARPKLSATIICFNEEEKIRGALESVRFCDEVVVIDSGSTDGTLEICRELADVVIKADWPGHVEQKNRALDHATGEWVLSLDSDERVTPELKREIEELLAGKPDRDGYLINRHVFYLGSWIDHTGWYPDPRIRLFKLDKGRWGGVDPHDTVLLDGRVGHLDHDIIHYTYDDMEHNIAVLNRFSSTLALEHTKRGRKFSWFAMLTRPPLEFLKKYILKRGFLDGPRGFFIASFSAFSMFAKFAKLWERQRVGYPKPWRDGE